MKKVYSGTTQKNYLTCAIKEEGKVFYLKSKLSGTGARFPNALFYADLETAILHAVSTAIDAGNDHPLVISGETEYYPYIPGDHLFQVNEVWILKDDAPDLNAIDRIYDSFSPQRISIKDYFVKKSAIDILNSLQSISLMI